MTPAAVDLLAVSLRCGLTELGSSFNHVLGITPLVNSITLTLLHLHLLLIGPQSRMHH